MANVLGTSAGALQNLQQVLDVVASNISNVNNHGYKRFDPLIEGVPSAPSAEPAGRLVVANAAFDVSLGEAQGGAGPLDFAIQDDAFFEVIDTDGASSFARLGALQVDGAGNVATLNGRFLVSPVALPQGWSGAAIDSAGVLSATDYQGAIQVIGQLTLVKFTNPGGLASRGDGLYRETVNSGQRTTGTPGSTGFAPIIAGAVEASNVDLAQEFATLILAQRAYQASARAFSLGDEMLKSATDITQ